MRSTTFRLAVTTIACALTFVACAKHEVQNVSPASSEPAASTTRSSPCNLPRGWDFTGGCTVGYLTHNGGTFELAPDRGIALTLTYGPNSASGKHIFIVGTAAGDDEISGSLNGKLPFPAFSTVACLTPQATPVTCSGKALLYVLVVNVRSAAVAFPMTPGFTLRSVEGFPDIHSCNINTMQWDGSDHTGFVWVAHAQYVTPSHGEMHFAPVRRPQNYASGGALTVFAVVCN